MVSVVDLVGGIVAQQLGGAVIERLSASAAESAYAAQKMARLGIELLRNVGDGRVQAASGCWLTASMPSMNFMPVISFGN